MICEADEVVRDVIGLDVVLDVACGDAPVVVADGCGLGWPGGVLIGTPALLVVAAVSGSRSAGPPSWAAAIGCSWRRRTPNAMLDPSTAAIVKTIRMARRRR